ncbi:Uncharacterised protein [Salmonella enterica subsp. enterica]|nr:Uncharacterised protein [Salmonella enterica subsp. enterica serovar Senftenberg]SUG91863.1 Uncharacterised protein [Salmonella enterica subsp. enterica]
MVAPLTDMFLPFNSHCIIIPVPVDKLLTTDRYLFSLKQGSL